MRIMENTSRDIHTFRLSNDCRFPFVRRNKTWIRNRVAAAAAAARVYRQHILYVNAWFISVRVSQNRDIHSDMLLFYSYHQHKSIHVSKSYLNKLKNLYGINGVEPGEMTGGYENLCEGCIELVATGGRRWQ